MARYKHIAPARACSRWILNVSSPSTLLKVILCAYAQGVVSSRGIERLCREHVIFIALCGDAAPHFTTLTAFVSGLSEEVGARFTRMHHLCDRQGPFPDPLRLIRATGCAGHAVRVKWSARSVAPDGSLDEGLRPESGLSCEAPSRIPLRCIRATCGLIHNIETLSMKGLGGRLAKLDM